MMEDSMVAAAATDTKMSCINLVNMMDTVVHERNSIGGRYARGSLHGISLVFIFVRFF